jgi:hypothetical protein
MSLAVERHIMKTIACVFAVGMACFSTACGDSMAGANPTAPSAVRGVSLSAEAGDASAASGSMKNDKDKEKGKKKNDRTPSSNTSPRGVIPLPPGLTKVEIEGLIVEVTPEAIMVNQEIVALTADTVIRHGNRRFESSQLRVGDRVHVTAKRVRSTSASITSATLEATEVKLQREGDEADEAGDEESEQDGEDDPDLPSVTVQASDSSASESGRNTGTFRLSRSGSKWAAPLTVSFTLDGTAMAGTDYASVPLTVTFARGKDRVDIVVRPVADTVAEGTETVILTLTAGTSYRVGSRGSATLNVNDATLRR